MLDGVSPRAKSLAIFTLKLAVSAVILALVLRGTDLERLISRLESLNPVWLVGAIGAYLAMMAVSTWRWRVLLHAQHVDLPFRTLWSSFWVAVFFNNFLPSNIGGDVVRIADTARRAGSKTLATTIVLIDRGLGLVALCFIASIGSLAATRSGLHVPGERWIWIAGAAGAAGLAPILTAPGRAGHLLSPLRPLEHQWIRERVARLDDALARFGARRSALVEALAGALVVQAGIVAFYLLTARALDIPLALEAAAILVPISLVVQMAPIAINGFGVREAVFIWFFARFGLTAEAAVALSLTAAGLMMALSLLGGVAFLTRSDRPATV
ncbi:MAG: lysylphosphatidylglycerol synthase transmembrane domain-containing protein [Acidobacteriota bacterium]